jgi:hypothetical protein
MVRALRGRSETKTMQNAHSNRQCLSRAGAGNNNVASEIIIGSECVVFVSYSIALTLNTSLQSRSAPSPRSSIDPWPIVPSGTELRMPEGGVAPQYLTGGGGGGGGLKGPLQLAPVGG